MKINYEKDIVERSHNMPVVAQFTANWCGPCKIMKPMVASVQNKRDDFALVLVDVDNNPEPSIKHGIRGIPTVLMFKNGEAVSKYTGGFSAVKFNNWINVHVGS